MSLLVIGSGLLDDLKTVAVLVAEGEHGRHAWPAQHLARVDAVIAQVGMVGVGVGGDEPDTGLDAGGQALARRYERDRRRCSRRRYPAPAPAPRPRGGQALPAARWAACEIQRALL